MFLYYEYYLLGIILIPGLLLALIAQIKINRTYQNFSRVNTVNNQTASEVARFLLDSAGLQHVKVVRVKGHLTDHYDPKKQLVALSSGIYDSKSVSAIGIAAHEVGHAVQYKEKYKPIKIRAILIPTINISSYLIWPLLILGIFLNYATETSSIGSLFAWVGIAIFGLSVLLNLVTLPVEYDASNRALRTLERTQILNKVEVSGAKQVLSAAALTYVAAMVISVLNLIRFILLVRRN